MFLDPLVLILSNTNKTSDKACLLPLDLINLSRDSQPSSLDITDEEKVGEKIVKVTGV